MFDIPTADILSLAWFVAVWVGYTWYADRGALRTHSLRAVMHAHRQEWMRQMVLRDNRVADVNILRNLLQGRRPAHDAVQTLVLAGEEAQKYGDPSQPHFHPRDREMAVDIDRYPFAIRVQREGGDAARRGADRIALAHEIDAARRRG